MPIFSPRSAVYEGCYLGVLVVKRRVCCGLFALAVSVCFIGAALHENQGLNASLCSLSQEEGPWKEQEAPRRDTPVESSCAAAAIGTPEGSPSGITNSFFRKALSWPLVLPWGLLHVPQSLLNWIRGLLRAAGLHFRDNAYNYCYTYELLSLGLPLLWVFSEVLASMYQESEESLETLRSWVLRCFPVKLR